LLFSYQLGAAAAICCNALHYVVVLPLACANLKYILLLRLNILPGSCKILQDLVLILWDHAKILSRNNLGKILLWSWQEFLIFLPRSWHILKTKLKYTFVKILPWSFNILPWSCKDFHKILPWFYHNLVKILPWSFKILPWSCQDFYKILQELAGFRQYHGKIMVRSW
jgi:hypothetical protein